MRRTLQIVLPLAFVLLAALAVRAMVTIFAEEASTQPVALPRAVQVVTAQRAAHAATIQGFGAVEAHRQVDLTPQVQGRVVAIADGLAPGRPFKRGERLVQIEDRDYRNNLAQAQANLARAELDLALERGRVDQSRREWALLGEEPVEGLATRQPQIAAATAAVDSARAAVDSARLNVERTRLVAPFDGVVITESAEVGQVVAPGAPVARLIATDRYRVRVHVPAQSLQWIDLPDSQGEGGATAQIVWSLPDGHRTRTEGRLTRVLGELDPQTRTAGLLVLLDNPTPPGQGPPVLLPGAWVDVHLEGRPVPDVIELPRVALHDQHEVLVADGEDSLRRRSVTVAFGTEDHVYVSEGLEEGERVITTPISLPVDGMQLAVQPTQATN